MKRNILNPMQSIYDPESIEEYDALLEQWDRIYNKPEPEYEEEEEYDCDYSEYDDYGILNIKIRKVPKLVAEEKKIMIESIIKDIDDLIRQEKEKIKIIKKDIDQNIQKDILKEIKRIKRIRKIKCKWKERKRRKMKLI